MNVVVVGGGVAGIAAALELAGAGASVTLVEVRPRLGGAAYSVARGDLWLDNGQHVFLRCCTAYRDLLATLGSTELVEVQPRLRIPVLAPGRPAAILRRSGARPPLHLAGALLRYPLLSFGERVRAGRAALALGRAAPDDSRTLGDWLTEHGQSPRAIAALWDLIALPTLNLPAAEASLALGAFVFQVGLLQDAAAGDIGVHRTPLQQIIGDPAAGALEAAGVTVLLRWRAERVTTVGSRFAVVGAGRSWLGADAVIVAVPHDRAAGILPEVALRGAPWPGALGSSPIVNLHVVYDRRVLEHPFAAGVDTPVQYVFDRTPAAWNGTRQYIAVSLSGARAELAMSPQALRERYLPALSELLPAARDANVELFTATKEHAATFAAIPGTAALRPPAATAVPGLALAGAWTSTGWPATLEGATRSGIAAAQAVLARG